MHFSLAFILFIRIFGFVNESNKQIDTFSQLRLPLIVLITFAHSYSGVRAGWTLWDGGWDTYEVLKLVVSETLVKVVAHYVFFFAFLDAGFFSLFGTSTASLCIHYLTLPLLKVGILIGVYVVYRYCIFSKILSLPKRHKAT